MVQKTSEMAAKVYPAKKWHRISCYRVPELLKLLDIRESTITIDAIGKPKPIRGDCEGIFESFVKKPCVQHQNLFFFW